jgi:hypothetical protein
VSHHLQIKWKKAEEKNLTTTNRINMLKTQHLINDQAPGAIMSNRCNPDASTSFAPKTDPPPKTNNQRPKTAHP